MKMFEKVISEGARLFGGHKGDNESSSGTCTMEHVERKFPTLSTSEMVSAIRKGNAVILDARYGKHDDGCRIPGAKSLNENSKKVEIELLLPDKAVKIITYCTNLQCLAGENLASHLRDLGYLDIWEYPEGIEGWRAAGMKVEFVER